jgi:hypothetical protein
MFSQLKPFWTLEYYVKIVISDAPRHEVSSIPSTSLSH